MNREERDQLEKLPMGTSIVAWLERNEIVVGTFQGVTGEDLQLDVVRATGASIVTQTGAEFASENLSIERRCIPLNRIETWETSEEAMEAALGQESPYLDEFGNDYRR
jgi:hypothetical protein